MAEDYLGFVGAIIGGAISGVVGIFIARYSNNLQDKDRLKDNVYRKLYGFIYETYKSGAPVDYSISTDPWSKMEPYELIKMDQKIRAEFEKLSSEILQWNAFATGLYNNYMQKQENIRRILQDAFSQSSLLNTNGNFIVGDSSYSAEGFLQMYVTVIMDPNIKDSETLYKNMEEFAQRNYPYRKEITYLKEHNWGFFEILLKQLPILRSMCLLDFNYVEMMKLRETIKDHVKALKDPLEKLAK
ncbi:MAG: hypothetical protein KGH85_06670 [Thaumarchaeota archaeon]|nr:hypothetical protein [Nitrososphaerota archaeon]